MVYKSVEDMKDDHTPNFKKGDHAVNVARLKHLTKKKVTAPKLWSAMTEGQRQQWREWYRKEQELKTAKNSTTDKKENDNAGA